MGLIATEPRIIRGPAPESAGMIALLVIHMRGYCWGSPSRTLDVPWLRQSNQGERQAQEPSENS